MSNKATVELGLAPVGTEFDPALLRANVLPDVTVPTDLAGDIKIDELQVVNNLTVTGNITSPSIRTFLQQLDDVDSTTNPQDGFVLIYNSSTQKYSPGPRNLTTRLDQLEDVDHSGVRDLSVLQYDDTQAKWVARAEDEFFDATIDGGFADTLHLEVFDVDGGFS
jgi:hypothetical protein